MRRSKGTKLVAALLVLIMLFGLVGAGTFPLANDGKTGISVSVTANGNDAAEGVVEMTAKLIYTPTPQTAEGEDPAPAESEDPTPAPAESKLVYDKKAKLLVVSDEDIEKIIANDESKEFDIKLSVSVKVSDEYNAPAPIEASIEDYVEQIENGKITFKTLNIELQKLPTATVTLVGDLEARDGCSVIGMTAKDGKVVITGAAAKTEIKLVAGFEIKDVENVTQQKKYESINAALADIEEDSEITATVEKTDNTPPKIDAKAVGETTKMGPVELEKWYAVVSDATDETPGSDVKIKVTKENGNEIKPEEGTKDKYFIGEDVVTVTATDAAGNSAETKIGKFITVTLRDRDDNGEYTKPKIEIIVSTGLPSEEHDYRLVIEKEPKTVLGQPKECYKEGVNATTGTIIYVPEVSDNYTVKLQQYAWGLWKTVQENTVEVVVDKEAPTFSPDTETTSENATDLGVLNKLSVAVLPTNNDGSSEEANITVSDNLSGVAEVRYRIYHYVEKPTEKTDPETGEKTEITTREQDYLAGETSTETEDGFVSLNIADTADGAVEFESDWDGEMLYIELHAVDKAGNKSETVTYTATCDTTAPKIDNITWTGTATNDNYDNYYGTERIATITVSDKNLDNGTVTIVKNGDKKNPITIGIVGIDNQGNLKNFDKDGISTAEKVIIFKGDGVYEITEIKAVDKAGNVTTKTTDLGGEFVIDKTAPTVEAVEFDCACHKDGAGKDFSAHKDSRTATITVSDKNLVNGTVTIVKNGDIENPITIDIDNEGNLVNPNRNDISADKKVITFNDDGVYEITEIKAVDKAGNETTKTTDLGGELVIDKTAPTVEVTYSSVTEAKNGKFFNAQRKATITVTEVNFNGEIKLVEDFKDCTKPGVYVIVNLADGDEESDKSILNHDIKNDFAAANWSSVDGKDDVQSITVTYDANKAYTFEIKVIDKAGNSGVFDSENPVDKDFTVDKDIYPPVITGVSEGGAYSDTCVPVITFKDANYESGEVRIYRTREGQINLDVTSSFGTGIVANGGTGGVCTVNTIAKTPENDGIYTIVASMTDKAGNSSESRVTFSVNRFGSVYKLGDEVNGLRNKYVREIDKDLVLTELNPDMLVSGSAKVNITRNGKPIDVIFSISPNPDKNGAAIGSSGWYEYVYTISAENFKKDGAYVITVSSTDEAGNNSSTTSYEECSMEFWVDGTKPEFTSLAGLESAIINAETAPVTFGVHDDIGISKITVYCDGKTIASFEGENIADVNNFEGNFEVPGGSNQVIRIVVEDLAGNITDTEKLIEEGSLPEFMENIEDITVSTNFFVRWFANKLVFFGSIIGILAVGTAAWWFLLGKKRSKSEANS